MRFFQGLVAFTTLMVAVPAAAYTLTGVIDPNNGFSRDLSFDHDGTVTVDVRLTSTSPFAVDPQSALLDLAGLYYDFYDPQTGDYLGGDDNFGIFFEWESYGADLGRRDYVFHLSYPGAQIRRDYVIQAPGDPFPSEVGYTETFLRLDGFVTGNADPVSYIITVDGTAVVPEPATWALLIGGFGLSGTALRRRRAVTSA